jgi:hypothetical protein
MQWNKVYPTLLGVACAASLLLSTKVSAASLAVVGPVTDLPNSFAITWSIANGVGTYHGTNWDAQLTISKTNVLLNGQYIGSSDGGGKSVTWNFPRVTMFAANSQDTHNYPQHSGWRILFNDTNHGVDDLNSQYDGIGPRMARVQAVHAPEPSTLLLFPGIGLAWLAVFRRKLFKKGQDACPAESVTTA